MLFTKKNIGGLEVLSVDQVDMMLDKDWLKLITQAKELGLSVEEIRLFLQNESKK